MKENPVSNVKENSVKERTNPVKKVAEINNLKSDSKIPASSSLTEEPVHFNKRLKRVVHDDGEQPVAVTRPPPPQQIKKQPFTDKFQQLESDLMKNRGSCPMPTKRLKRKGEVLLQVA